MMTDPICRRWKWKSSQVFCAIVLCNLCVSISTHAGSRKYEAYYDMVADKPFYDGVKAQIDFVEPPVGSKVVYAWCGLDNNNAKGFWAQAGWCKYKDEAAKVYWEYTDENDKWVQGYDTNTPPIATEVFEVVHDGADMIWKRQASVNTVYKKMPWTDFDSKNFCKAQYGAEMVDSTDDHTPGKATNKNDWFDVRVRRTGGAYEAAPLGNNVDNAGWGRIEKYDSAPPGLSNFRTWDTRD